MFVDDNTVGLQPTPSKLPYHFDPRKISPTRVKNGVYALNKVMNGPTKAKIGPTRAKTRLKRVKNCVLDQKLPVLGG